MLTFFCTFIRVLFRLYHLLGHLTCVIFKLFKTNFSDSDFSDNSDSEDNNSTPAGPSGETLQSNINKFLYAAKEQAKLGIEKQILAENKISLIHLKEMKN